MAGNEDNPNTAALNTIISALTQLNSEDRHRVVSAAMMFLGEKPIEPANGKGAGDGGDDEQAHSSAVQRWMKQNGVSAQQLEQVFHFGENGSFDILEVAGSTKKERMLNTYLLTGLAKYLATGDRKFDDATARGYCERFACYDQANFAAHMRERGSNFTGERTKGYVLTNVGIKHGATLVKEIAGAAQ